MKSIGIVRKVDNLGRLALPIEMRKTMNIKSKDPLEIFVDGDSIIFKKYESGCYFCSSFKDNILHKEKKVCKSCLEELIKKTN
ncbi:MAG: AbrB/MazE/SpoVT family DNA-binding domain-containing protein [Halanaerobium sp.]